MFLKLLKHEFKNNRSTFLIIYAITLLLAIFIGLSGNSDGDGPIFGLILFLYVITILGMFIFNIISIVRSFSRSMFEKPSYLTLTLPVSTTQIVLSKVLMAVIWIILSYIAVLFSALIIMVLVSGVDFGDLFEIVQHFNLDSTFFIFALYMFVGLVYFVFLMYFCLTVINTSFIRNHKKLISVVIFFVLTYVLSQLQSVVIPSGEVSGFYGSYITRYEFSGAVHDFNTYMMSYLLPSTLYNLVICILLFFGIKVLIEKKIEIE